MAPWVSLPGCLGNAGEAVRADFGRAGVVKQLRAPRLFDARFGAGDAAARFTRDNDAPHN